MANPYSVGLDKNPANYAPLTPLSFIARSAAVYPERLALIHGRRRQTWSETYRRCRRLASALAARKVGAGDTVAAILNNTPEMFECHFGVPMSGAVLNTLNTRLDAATIAFMLNHSEARVLIVDREYATMVKTALGLLGREILVVDVDDPEYAGLGVTLGALDYESLLSAGDPDYAWRGPADEW
ncbi:MAG TPA: AMP-binding protein, partial [Rhodocyclaceae bacterium]|nr:AMP-binding protein [Rhodocyclaceae bacterium]